MAQASTRKCPHCGTSAAREQQYCHQCGSPIEASASAPTALSTTISSSQIPPTPLDPYLAPTVKAPYSAPTEKAPPRADPYAAPTEKAPPRAGASQQPVANYALPLAAAYMVSQNRSTRRGLRRVGCSLGIAAAVILVLLSGVGYFFLHAINSQSTSTASSNPDATPTQSPIITTPLNETVTYASVIIKLVSAQQANRFVDDNSTSSVGALRLNVHESQSAPLDTGGGTTDPYYGYDKAFNLILPGGKAIGPDSTKIVSGPTGKASQDNWLDFSVPTGIKVNQLTLRIGNNNEAQMDVPLSANARLSIYQPQVVHLTTRVPYGDMFWTLTTASKQWSDGGKQAGSGQRFIVLAVSVDNPSSSDVNAFPPDYIRLQVGGNQIAEANDSMPTEFAPGTTGSKGLVSFLVPPDSTSFSLVLLGNGTANATIPFNIP